MTAGLKSFRRFQMELVENLPVFAAEVTGEVAAEVRLILVLRGEMTRKELQSALGLKHEEHFRKAYLEPAIKDGLIEMTIPEKPRSRLQKYRLTEAGRALLASHDKKMD